jgi:CubicO group peptidase (beta-lactamase class C family)
MASEPVARSESFTVFIPELERLITEVMEEWKVPGLAVAVVQNGEVVFVRPCGLRDVEAGLKVTTDTQFQLMSVSKPFTATGLALLVDERRMQPEFRDVFPRCAICFATIPGCRVTRTGFFQSKRS